MNKTKPPKIDSQTVKNARDATLKAYTQAVASKTLRSGIPATLHRLFLRCQSKEASPRQAIKAFCLECTGYTKEAVTHCSAPKCPLFKYRPYQK